MPDIGRGPGHAHSSRCRSSILREHLDDFVLVGEEQIRAAQRTMIEATRNLVEAAGRGAAGGALELREQLAGRRVALWRAAGT